MTKQGGVLSVLQGLSVKCGFCGSKPSHSLCQMLQLVIEKLLDIWPLYEKLWAVFLGLTSTGKVWVLFLSCPAYRAERG